MQTIKKVLNSSVVLVEDERGVERVLLGKGIGFGAKSGELVAEGASDRVFVALDDSDHRNLVELLAQIPAEYVELARDIVAMSTDAGFELDPHIYLTLTDHLHFATDRHRRGMIVANRLDWEFRRVYAREHEIGMRSVQLMRERLGVDLPDGEAANIAFHLVNADVGRPGVDSMRVVQLVASITKIVTHLTAADVGRDDLHSARFAVHLQFFAERLFAGRLLEADDFLFTTLAARSPRAIAAAERVREFVVHEYGTRIPDEEVAYIALHIARAMPE